MNEKGEAEGDCDKIGHALEHGLRIAVLLIARDGGLRRHGGVEAHEGLERRDGLEASRSLEQTHLCAIDSPHEAMAGQATLS